MVHSCDGCGKHLAPFYFFEESEQSGVADNGLVMSLRPEAIGYQPLWGFSAHWSGDIDPPLSPDLREGTDREFRKIGNESRPLGHPKGSRKN